MRYEPGDIINEDGAYGVLRSHDEQVVVASGRDWIVTRSTFDGRLSFASGDVHEDLRAYEGKT